MSLFPRLVVLVACVPLLVPPGLCACGTEAVVPVTPIRAEHAAPKPTPAKHCGCKHATKSAPTTAPSAVPVPHDHEHHVPHAPNCPVVSGADRAQLAERAEPVDHLTALAFVCSGPDPFALAELFPGEDRRPHSAPLFEDRPRFITHCALLF